MPGVWAGTEVRCGTDLRRESPLAPSVAVVAAIVGAYGDCGRRVEAGAAVNLGPAGIGVVSPCALSPCIEDRHLRRTSPVLRRLWAHMAIVGEGGSGE